MPVAHKGHSGLTTAVWCGVASQALSAMEVSCRASLGPVSKREVTAGADHSAHILPNPSASLEFLQVIVMVPLCPKGSGRALLRALSRDSGGSSCLHRNPACCSLLTQRACFGVHCL